MLIYVCADAVWNMGGMKAVWKTGSADAAQSGSGAHSKGKMPVPEKLMFTVLGASGAGKHSGCDPDVLAAWKASVTVYNRNPLFHAGNLTKKSNFSRCIPYERIQSGIHSGRNVDMGISINAPGSVNSQASMTGTLSIRKKHKYI